VAIVSISDLRYQAAIGRCSQGFRPFGDLLTECIIPSVRMQLADSSRQWTTQQSVELILQRLQQAGLQAFGQPKIEPASNSKAFYEVPSRSPMGQFETWGSITLYNLPNPALGRGMVTTLALIAGCSAPSRQVETFRHVCAGALRSFRATPEWSSRIASAIADGYSQEAQILLRIGQNVVQGFAAREQMINSAGQAMQKMQYDSFEARQAALMNYGQSEIATLAEEDLVRDPNTGGLVPVPLGYSSHCVDSTGSKMLSGNNLAPGRSQNGYICARMVP
jgi:hypothetical protein